MPKIARNIGFESRTFLTESEWHTYCRRKPVRYIRKKKQTVCEVCRTPPSAGNGFQNAHIIGFDIGVIELALTPDFLDSDANIVTAHQITCNKATELDLRGSMTRLRSLGVTELPKFLPNFIHEMWRSTAVIGNLSR